LKIAIVTIVRNDPEGLKETIQSLKSQAHQPDEFIVIDGASTDEKTLEVIKSHQDFITSWVSESDRGIYDAMNKGVRMAQSEWINFMNAGDRFYNENSLSSLFQGITDEASMIYGNSYFEPLPGKDKPVFWQSQKQKKNFWKKMPFSHQSLLAKKSLLEKFPFSLKNRIVSDFEFIIKSTADGAAAVYVDAPVVLIERGGISHQKIILRTWERFKVVMKYMPSAKRFVFYVKLMASIILSDINKKLWKK